MGHKIKQLIRIFYIFLCATSNILTLAPMMDLKNNFVFPSHKLLGALTIEIKICSCFDYWLCIENSVSSCLRKSPICFASFLAIIIFFLGYCVPHACLDKISPPVARVSRIFCPHCSLKNCQNDFNKWNHFSKVITRLYLKIVYITLEKWCCHKDRLKFIFLWSQNCNRYV